MSNNYLSVLYKHIIQVENENVWLKVGGGGVGGAQTYHCPSIKKVGGGGRHKHTLPPPPLPTPVIYIYITGVSKTVGGLWTRNSEALQTNGFILVGGP